MLGRKTLILSIEKNGYLLEEIIFDISKVGAIKMKERLSQSSYIKFEEIKNYVINILTNEQK